MRQNIEYIKIEEPKDFPITIERAKNYLRISGKNDDELILDLIKAATELAESFLSLRLVEQVWVMNIGECLPTRIMPNSVPILEILEVNAIDIRGQSTKLPNNAARIVRNRMGIEFDRNYCSHNFEIKCKVGFGKPENIPSSIKQGILNHVSYLYDNRGGGEVLPPESKIFYQPYRQIIL